MKPIPLSPSALSKAQIAQYLSVIRFEAKIDQDHLPQPTLETLNRINILHLVTFPFDTTAIHYTESHFMDVTPQGAFRWFVDERRGGSYCFGHNILLLEVLKGLGYHAYSGAGEIEDVLVPLQQMSRCAHIMLFVQIPGDTTERTYLVDVGLGVTGLVKPILLSDDESNVERGASPTEAHRLRRINTPEGHPPGNVWWRLEHQRPLKASRPEQTWDSAAIFSEIPYTSADFEHASKLINDGPCQRFWWIMVCIRYFFADPQSGAEIPPPQENEVWNEEDIKRADIGRYTLDHDTVKRTVGAVTELVKVVKTEEERIEVLKEFFGIRYDVGDARHVVGRAGALGSGFVPPVFPKRSA